MSMHDQIVLVVVGSMIGISVTVILCATFVLGVFAWIFGGSFIKNTLSAWGKWKRGELDAGG